MNTKILAFLVLIILVSIFSFAQEDAEKKEQDDSKQYEGIKKRIEAILDIDFVMNEMPEIRKRVILDFPSLLATISSADNSFKFRVSNPAKNITPVLIFSTTIFDPYAGSPAYDVVSGPRFSMNVDRVSGKYYWEW